MTAPRPSFLHLARRFRSVLVARPLAPAEQQQVDDLLAPEERSLFWAQAPADQRHGLETARRVAAARPGDATAVRAALLHDVGKRHAGLGPLGRTLATLAGRIGRDGPASWKAYLRHGPLGATDLVAAGSDPLVVEFARHHPGPPPAGIDPHAWAVLLAADDD